jgi:hypothetical protein
MTAAGSAIAAAAALHQQRNLLLIHVTVDNLPVPPRMLLLSFACTLAMLQLTP